jgi:hypothetical protein
MDAAEIQNSHFPFPSVRQHTPNRLNQDHFPIHFIPNNPAPRGANGSLSQPFESATIPFQKRSIRR